MTEPMDDEQWVAGLRDRALGAVPPVPVDVSGALRRGRRRRAVRSGVVGGGALVAVCGVAVVVAPQLLSGLSVSSQDMADSAAPAASAAPADDGAVAGGAPVPGAEGRSPYAVSLSELGAEVEDGTLPAGTVRVVVDGVPDTGALILSLQGSWTDQAGSAPTPVTAERWPAAMVDCLDAAGWPAQLTGTGWSADIESDKAREFAADVVTCAEANPHL